MVGADPFFRPVDSVAHQHGWGVQQGTAAAATIAAAAAAAAVAAVAAVAAAAVRAALVRARNGAHLLREAHHHHFAPAAGRLVVIEFH
jgi:hypothetical protein